MRWTDGLTREEMERRKKQWHRWFAWYPVRLDDSPDGHKVYRWLETVERRMEPWEDMWDSGWERYYRALAKAKGE
jgi:hypothetical protein